MRFTRTGLLRLVTPFFEKWGGIRAQHRASHALAKLKRLSETQTPKKGEKKMSESSMKAFSKTSAKSNLKILRWLLSTCLGTAAVCCVLYLLWFSRTAANARDFRINATNLTKVSLRSQLSAMPAKRTAVFQAFAQRPLSFERNVGQADSSIEFVSHGAGYSLALSSKEAVLSLSAGDKRKGLKEPHAPIVTTTALRMSLVGANENAAITGIDPLPYKVNYLIGNDPKRWKLHVPHYARVKYEGVYRGIDLVYYGNQRQLEYDFVVAPGADPGQIQLSFDGAKSLRVDPTTGDLVIRAASGAELRHQRPAIYQIAASEKTNIAGSYRILDQTHAAFTVASYDPRKPVVIDPTLDFTTNFGGSSFDTPAGIAVDNAGNAYVAGETLSTDFPEVGTQPGASGCTLTVHPLNAPLIRPRPRPNSVTPKATLSTGTCASPFVVKISPQGQILFSSYMGGDSSTSANGIAADSTGVFITGSTAATNFITNATYAFGGENAYVADLDPSGDSFHWVVGLGGGTANGGANVGVAITLDAQHAAYIAGYTTAVDFPTTEYFQGQHKSWQPVFGVTNCSASVRAIIGGLPCQNGFVAKVVQAAGKGTLDGGYSTYIGGSVFDSADSIAVDSTGHAYVTGVTFSFDFPALASNAGGPPQGDGVTAFVTKLLPDGSGAMYSNFLGGKEDATDGPPDDSGIGIAVDWLGQAYVTGATCSTNFPVTPGGYHQFTNCTTAATIFNDNGYAAVLSPLGQLMHSTYVSGPPPAGEQIVSTVGRSIAINSMGEIYVGGITSAVNILGTPNPYQSDAENTGFLMKFTPSLAPVFINFMGAEVHGVAVQPPGSGILGILESLLFSQVYATGAAPRPGTDVSNDDNFDVFVSKWTDSHVFTRVQL